MTDIIIYGLVALYGAYISFIKPTFVYNEAKEFPETVAHLKSAPEVKETKSTPISKVEVRLVQEEKKIEPTIRKKPIAKSSNLSTVVHEDGDYRVYSINDFFVIFVFNSKTMNFPAYVQIYNDGNHIIPLYFKSAEKAHQISTLYEAIIAINAIAKYKGYLEDTQQPYPAKYKKTSDWNLIMKGAVLTNEKGGMKLKDVSLTNCLNLKL